MKHRFAGKIPLSIEAVEVTRLNSVARVPDRLVGDIEKEIESPDVVCYVIHLPIRRHFWGGDSLSRRVRQLLECGAECDESTAFRSNGPNGLAPFHLERAKAVLHTALQSRG